MDITIIRSNTDGITVLLVTSERHGPKNVEGIEAQNQVVTVAKVMSMTEIYRGNGSLKCWDIRCKFTKGSAMKTTRLP